MYTSEGGKIRTRQKINAAFLNPYLLPGLVKGGELGLEHTTALKGQQLSPLVPDRKKQETANNAHTHTHI